MKKFKTKNSLNRIKILLLLIALIALFIAISFYKSNTTYPELEKILLSSFSSNDNKKKLTFLTKNLDNLFNDYYFNDMNKIKQNTNPIVYLYNTHKDEKYQDNTTIQKATSLLKDNLLKLGIYAIQEEMPADNYTSSRQLLTKIMQNNENIRYYLDIHRDSVSDTTIKINNKLYAKTMFVLGLENPNYLQNKAILLKMNDYLNQNYPGLSRGIYEKKGSGVDGVYNQDLGDNVLLIEIGGVTNNLTEINNSTEIISLMLYHFLGD